MGLKTTLIGMAAMVGAFVTCLTLAPDADAAPGAKAQVSAEWTCGQIHISAAQDVLNVQLVIDGNIRTVFTGYEHATTRELRLPTSFFGGDITAALVEVGPGPAGRVETINLRRPDCEPTERSLAVDDLAVRAGDTFDVDVRLDPGTEVPLTLGFAIEFDPTLVAPVTAPRPIELGPVCVAPLGAAWPICGPMNPTNTVAVALFSPFGWTEPTVATTIRFQALANASGVTALKLTEVESLHPLLGDLAIDLQHGSVTVGN